jgi:hypothetical protein
MRLTVKFWVISLLRLMGQCQAKTKRLQKIPPASVLVCGAKNEISLKNYISCLKLVRSIIIFVLGCCYITELFKNSVRKK